MPDTRLAAVERELAAIYDNLPGIVFYVVLEPDGEFRFLSMSQAGLAATGLTREQFTGTLVRHVIPATSRELVLRNYREAIRTRRTVRWKEVSEYPAGRKIGEVAVTPLFGPDGVPTHLIGIVHDVTEQEQLAEAMRAVRDAAHNRELKLLLETATQGILSVDQQGLIATANNALERMFGWAPGELIGRPVETLMPAFSRQAHARHRAHYFTAPHARLMGGGPDLVGERKDGSTFPVEVSLNHVVTAAGGRAFAFVTDISERHERTAELQRRTAQLSRLASDLTLAEHHAREQIAKTLHDGLQQMLVSAALDLERCVVARAQQETQADDVLLRVKGHIDEAIAAARSLSFELFPPVLHTSGLPAAVRWLANQMRSKYGITVEVEADPLADCGRRDVRSLLYESIRELLFNAVKHAKAGCAAVHLAVDDDQTLRIVVEDSGVGFDPAELAERGSSGSIGWGLFSIRERLALLGGRLDIDSRPGTGARFSLIAPCSGPDDTERRGAPTRTPSSVPAPRDSS